MKKEMESVETQDLRYPIGKFKYDADSAGEDAVATWIEEIEQLPERLTAVVAGVSETQLDTPYRGGGWAVRQTVHHMADSHINSFMRFKLALTESNPTIKPYDEALWANTADSTQADVALSLQLLAGLHARWAKLLRSLTKEQWDRTFMHPDSGTLTLRITAAIYAWHCKHHVAHIANLKQRMGWT